MERRLAAILSADVVGYTTIIGLDEAGTLSRLKAHRRELIEPKAAQHRGRTIKLMGDGALMEFASAVDAVAFAVDVQLAMAEREAEIPADRRIRFRVGINIGDVAVDGDDLYGDGVNVAARIEALAPPGGITLTQSVAEHLHGRLDLTLEDLGRQTLKGIEREVRVHAVVLDERAASLATPVVEAPAAPAAPATITAARSRPALSAVALVTLLALALGGVATYWTGDDADASLVDVPYAAPVASILVLPFEDLSLDDDLGYFADGMTEDIIAELSRWQEISVVSRHSANTFKGRAVDVREAAREMNVRYVLEGTVRSAGEDRLRVTAQLTDGETGQKIWGDRFDETGEDVLALQDKVTGRLVATIEGNHGALREDQNAKAWAKADVDLTEYDFYLRGHDIFYRFTPESTAEARRIWQAGLDRFPDSGLLKIKLGWADMLDARYWSEDKEASFAASAHYVEDGLADPNLPATGYRQGLWLRAYVQAIWKRDYMGAVTAAQEVVKAFPFDVEGLIWMASMMEIADRLDLAERWVDRALSREPNLPEYMWTVVGRTYYLAGRFEDAVTAFGRITNLWAEDLAFLAAALQAAGETDRAAAVAERLMKTGPDWDREALLNGRPYRNADVVDTLFERLNEAGWKQEVAAN